MDLTMRAKLLPAPYIIKGFVYGENDCNYEIYLLELLNRSTWFLKQYPGGFHKPFSESNGECDAINEKYQLDFKLFASKTELQARSTLSSRVYKMADGVSAFCESKIANGSINATRLFAAFRGLSLANLIEIRQIQNKAYGVNNDIVTVLSMLETEKNLLLFFPYKFTFDVPHCYTEAIESIQEALTEDFHTTFEYRDRHLKMPYDTFLTCIYNDSFLIFAVKDQILQFCDTIKTKEVKTFLRLSNYTDWWE